MSWKDGIWEAKCVHFRSKSKSWNAEFGVKVIMAMSVSPFLDVLTSLQTHCTFELELNNCNNILEQKENSMNRFGQYSSSATFYIIFKSSLLSYTCHTWYISVQYQEVECSSFLCKRQFGSAWMWVKVIHLPGSEKFIFSNIPILVA